MAKKEMSQAEKKVKNTSGKKSPKAAKQTPPPVEPEESARVPHRIVAALVCLALFTMLLLYALNQDGFVLSLLGKLVQGLFGHVAFYVFIPVLLFLFVVLAFSGERPVRMRCCCAVAFALLCGCIAQMCYPEQELGGGFALVADLYMGGLAGTTGGAVCGLLAMALEAAFGWILTFLVLILGAALSFLAAFGLTVPKVIEMLRERIPVREEHGDGVIPAAIFPERPARSEKKQEKLPPAQVIQPEVPEEDAPQKGFLNKLKGFFTYVEPDERDEVVTQYAQETTAPVPHAAASIFDIPLDPPVVVEPAGGEGFPPVEEIPEQKKVTAKEAAQSAREVAAEIAKASAAEKPAYKFPPIDLLRKPRSGSADGTAEMRENTKRLNEALASFKIDAHISNVTRGPSVTRYEVELEKGVRLNKLTSAADDIALNLGASGVRIAPVPGKISVVGIEVPNQAVTTVSLREVIDSQEFKRAESKSSFAVGKDIGGTCIVGNISKLPHMLIAGTTGSGKSVCMNSIIISLLYKASPEDVKLIMVDPKMVELGIYNGIPHLLIPVVTDPKKAAGSLQWAVTEMMRRYRSMSDAGVRDLESYNSMIEGGMVEGERLPQVVVIIDELADLMLVAAKEVEESICRIAQMGRASGIHLIIATQRPSADVITGLMKANIPSRIAFSVASAMESRIILDNPGAEKLVGKGDMLFAPIGSGKPQRVQGCFVSDAEVEAVASYVKEHFTTTYDQNVMEEIELKAQQTGTKSAGPITAADPEPSADEMAGDEMLPAAVEVILETKQASVSMLQRRLKLGYARAARIVDEMEEMGIVGPFQGSKPRQILITKEQWEQMKGGQTAIPEPEPQESFDEDLIDIPF